MMQAAVQGASEGADQAGVAKPLVIAVSVLTSTSPEVLRDEMGVTRPLRDQVVHLARLAQEAGCDGLVASPHEITAIQEACGPEFMLVIPGVRPSGAAIFVGFTLYDFSNIKFRYGPNDYVPATVGLYLDFLNLFWFLVQILLSLSGGSSRRN